METIGAARSRATSARSAPRRHKVRATAAILAAAILASACSAAIATPSPSGPTTPTFRSPSSQSPTSSPSVAPTPAPVQTVDTGYFAMAVGTAAPNPPAADFGVLAGTEINDFGFDLLRRLDTSGNLCASPASIALALAMVRAGANGDTAAEMDKVLHDFGSPGQAGEIATMLDAFKRQTFYDNFYSDDPLATPPDGQQPAAELDVSNAVFSQKGMSLEQAYLDTLSSEFGAGVGLLDYKADPEAARLIINRWASDRTKGRIPNVLQPGEITAATRIALADAIYLKAGWSQPFDEAATKASPFTLSSGAKVSVPTMALDKVLSYSAGKGYRAVDLPFSGESLSMTIVVPDDMTSFVNGLTAAEFSGIVSQAKGYIVDLTLPRFSADSRVELSPVLAAMGMPTAFDSSRADFSGITTDEKLFIQFVIHQANIDVVEKGTTAAAVTVVGVGTMGGGPTPPPPPHVTFHVDKPFLYFVREAGTGAILFMGRIDDPSSKS